MLKQEERLRYNGLFLQAYEKGKSLYSKNLRLTFTISRPNLKHKLPLVGFSVAKSFSKSAVKRNRLKRQLREIYRLYRRDPKIADKLKSLGLVVVAVKKSTFAGHKFLGRDAYKSLKAELESLFDQALSTSLS